MEARKRHRLKTLTITARCCVGGAVVLVLTSLSGWILDIESLKSFRSGWVAIKPNTIFSILSYLVAFILIGIYQLAAYARVLVWLGIAIASASLTRYMFHANYGIDELFFDDKQPVSIPGRITPLSAIG